MIGHLISLLLVFIVPQQDPAQKVDPAQHAIAMNNEWRITEAQYDEVLKTFPEQDRLRYVDPLYRRGLVNELVRIWVLCAEQRKKGIQIGSDYQSQKNFYQKFAQDIAATITDAVVRGYYDSHLDEFTYAGFSQILILNGSSPITPYADVERLPYKEAEAKAKEVKTMLDNGADWNEMVKKYSQDLATKENGGMVGYIPKGRTQKDLENVLFSMKIGEISDVVGTDYGFHIVR